MNTPQSPDSLYIIIKNALLYYVKDAYVGTIGLTTTFIGYLLPLRNIVHLMIAFFILDVLFGYWSAKIVKKQRFSVKIIWEHTIPRMVIAIILVICTFMWDKEYHQDYVSTHKIVGWFISGVLLASIVDNAYKITKWNAFPQISKLIKDKTKEKTNLDIETD